MKDEAGFTLVELLAAMVAGGLLLALLGALTGTFGANLRRSGRGDPFGDIATASTLLDRLLAGAEAGPGTSRPIDTDSGHLTTFIEPPLTRRGKGLMKLELTVVRKADGEALEMVLDTSEGAPADRRTLVHGLRAIDISIDQGDGPEPGRPPRLITVAFTTPARETWELAVEPRLTGAAGCRFDPISMSCRP